ncbi:LADA_0H15588g1_1 [Lachancea dasiensis]|uniref:LADA_0H15588g1_1 n=1 Tax=Lachancea dasiensis TaxID=1072105 RepID=A0A1G4K4W7_9SACH|nr:LADA_0H15588g1_1 [Lachancea dasiensis]
MSVMSGPDRNMSNEVCQKNLVVLSGGTAANGLLEAFERVSNELSFIMPISDNGGSTSEILRVVGGPAIGDIRSRIVRLIKDANVSSLLGYRLSAARMRAKQEWNAIVDGTHPIWTGFPSEVKEMCRSFLIHMQAELLKKDKTSAPFQFERASIGNLFLTGIRLFLGSLDSSIELALRVCRCDERISIIPCINTNHTHHISALLQNGDVITGQSQISHPSKQKGRRVRSSKVGLLPNASANFSTESLVGPNSSVHLKEQETFDTGFEELLREDDDDEDETDRGADDEEEFAYPGYIHPELKLSQLHFDKMGVGEEDLLAAPIKRILYINPYGEEVLPQGNSRAINKLKNSKMVIYSVGSLMTSLLPIIILGNVAETIVENEHAKKVLLVNNKYDRETYGMDGFHFVKMIVESMHRAVHNYKRKRKSQKPESAGVDLPVEWTKYVTDVLYLTRGEISVDTLALNNLGIRTYAIEHEYFEIDTLEDLLKSI